MTDQNDAVALTAPIVEGKVDRWKAFMRALSGERREEFRDLNERMDLTRHRAWLQSGPDGSYTSIIVMEGPGAGTFDARVARSDHPFDVWFREQLGEVHPIDPSEPPSELPELWVDA